MTAKPKWSLTIEPVVSETGWSVYRIPLGGFAVKMELRPMLRQFYAALDQQVRKHHPQMSAFLQYNQLNIENAGFLLAERGRDWMPEVGIGYEPHKPPPTLWTKEEFLSLGVGEMPRPMMNQLFLITTGEEASQQAVNELAGLGPVLVMRGPAPIQDVKQQARSRFQPLIQDIALKNFAWYVPLLNLKTFTSASAANFRPWTCGLTYYLRESPEDQGVVIACEEPLAGALGAAGAEPVAKGAWTWSPKG